MTFYCGVEMRKNIIIHFFKADVIHTFILKNEILFFIPKPHSTPQDQSIYYGCVNFLLP